MEGREKYDGGNWREENIADVMKERDRVRSGSKKRQREEWIEGGMIGVEGGDLDRKE